MKKKEQSCNGTMTSKVQKLLQITIKEKESNVFPVLANE